MTDLLIFEEMESEVRGYIRSFPVIFTKAKGSILFDEQGKEYVDFFSGAGTLNYGHNNPFLKEKVIDYLATDGVVHSLDMATTAKKQLLTTLDQRLFKPRHWKYVLQFTGPTGTNAVEAALKLARQVKARQNIVSFTHGFHGVSGGSLAVTANRKFRIAAGTALSNTTFLPYDGYLGPDVNTLAYFERMLEDPSSGLDHPAAVIVETIQGEGGVNVATRAWMQELQGLCKRHDMLLIVDDIQVGCGRTGNFFSFDEMDIQPDIITLSKSLSGFGLPMSLVLIKPELDQWKPGAHSGTFRGNNLAFVTAASTLDHYWSDDRFKQQIQAKAALVGDWLENIVQSYPDAGLSTRGRGLIQALVTPHRSGLAAAISARCFEQGLVIETSGAHDEVLKLLPALTISKAELQQGLEIIESSVAYALMHQSRKKVVKIAGARK